MVFLEGYGDDPWLPLSLDLSAGFFDELLPPLDGALEFPLAGAVVCGQSFFTWPVWPQV